MKKMTAAAILFAVITIFTACGEPVQPVVAVTPAPSDAPSVIAYPELSMFAEYENAKYTAVENMISAVVPHDNPEFVPEKIMHIGEAEVSMKPIEILGTGDDPDAKLAPLDITGLAVTKEKEGVFNIKYNRDGAAWELKCVRDEAAGSMQVSAVSGEEKYFFECMKTANGYASQYYIKGKSERVTIFIEGGDIYYGFTTVQYKPVSILDGSALTADIAKSEETYMTLIGGKFTLYINGIDCTDQY